MQNVTPLEAILPESLPNEVGRANNSSNSHIRRKINSYIPSCNILHCRAKQVRRNIFSRVKYTLILDVHRVANTLL